MKAPIWVKEGLKKHKAKIALGLTAMFIPGGGILAGALLLKRAFKKQKAQNESEPLSKEDQALFEAITSNEED